MDDRFPKAAIEVTFGRIGIYLKFIGPYVLSGGPLIFTFSFFS